MKVSIIAAIGKNRELGKDNKLLWHIKEDLQRFKSLTVGHPIIMGRKTWESLPFKPLPNRINIVVTRDVDKFKDLYPFVSEIVSSIESAIERAKATSDAKEVFIIGGGQIYKEALEKGLVDKLYLTLVNADSDADTFFPDYSQFTKIISEKTSESEGLKYKFIDLEK